MAASAGFLEVDAPIRRVTVFPNGALVTRRGRAAPGRVRVRGLPLLYASDSLRVRPARGSIADLEEVCALELDPAPPLPSEEERRALDRREAALDDELRTTEALLRVYAGLDVKDDPRARPKDALPDADRWLELLSLSKDRLLALEQRRDALVRDKRALTRARRALEQRERGDRAPPRFSRGVSFSLLGDEGQERGAQIELELEYFVEAARWVPSYALRLAEGRTELVLSALVAQASGEDWSEAELCFSTADLVRETTLPELSSWRIGRAQAPRRPAFRPLPEDLEALFEGYDASRRAPAPQRPPPAAPRKPREELRRIEDEWGETTDATAQSLPALGAARSAPVEGLSMSEALDDELMASAAFGGGAPEAMLSEAPAGAPPPPAPSRPGVRARAGAAPMAKRASMPPTELLRAEPEPLPPRLRYAYLRLAGPDEPGRGTLRPVDPLTHLWSLIEDHRGVDVHALRRAVDALKLAAERLRRRALPAGAVPVERSSFFYVYRAPGRHALASDGEYHRVVVDRGAAPSSVELRAVPRESDDVYRFCLVKTPPGVPYPAGPMQVYEEGAFRVSTTLDATSGGTDLELNLGVEPAVRILGRTAHVEQQEKGLVSQTSRVEHKVRVQLRSSLPHKARVVLYDRLPVPADDEKDIEVRLEESAPAPVRDDKDPRGQRLPGGLHWELDVEPGETRAVTWRYIVSLPAKAELVGGNRRE